MYGPKLTKKKGSDIVDGSIGSADIADTAAQPPRICKVTLGAESANVITATVQVVDGAGSNVSAATVLYCKVVGEAAADYTLSNVGGSGTKIGSYANGPELALNTHTDGSATFDITDVVGGSATAVMLYVQVVDTYTSGALTFNGYANQIAVTFD